MQAFRAAVTVDTDHELHIQQVPFRPGSVVEVIVLPAESVPASSREASEASDQIEEAVEDAKERLNGSKLARTQYSLARQYPQDYVIMVGERVAFHSPDRKAAFGAFDQACEDFPEAVPVIVEPGGKERKAPRFRGRSMNTRVGSRR